METKPKNTGGGHAAVNYLVIAAVFLIAGLLIGSMALGRGGLTRDDVEEIVRAAVREETAGLTVASADANTDSISREELREIVNEAVAELDPAASQTASIADDDPFQGPEDAQIVVVEFSDFNCGFCTRFAMETLPQIIENYGDQIKFVYRDMPILSESSAPAAQAGECANDQGKFWEFHDYMFTPGVERNRDTYLRFAEENGLDVAAFTECIDSGKYVSEVTLDLLDGQSLGVRGTPAFFINGRFISGAQPFDIFKTVIDAELAKLDQASGG